MLVSLVVVYTNTGRYRVARMRRTWGGTIWLARILRLSERGKLPQGGEKTHFPLLTLTASLDAVTALDDVRL